MKLPPVLEAMAESSDSSLARGFLRGRRLQQLAQVGSKAGGKAVPGVGEALMIADMARETAHQARKGARIAGTAVSESRKAKGIGAKARALAAGAGSYARHTLGSSLRVSAAALIGPSKANPDMREQVVWMLQTMPPDWRVQLDLCRAALQDAGVPAPPAKPTPEQALLALNLNNRNEPSSEVKPGQLQAGGVPVPDAVRKAAFAGLCLSHKHNYGGYRFIGIARAIQLVLSPTISQAALNRIRMYFDRKTKQDRLSVDYAAKKGKRYWSWLNWGGDPAAAWSRSSRFAELVQHRIDKENPVTVKVKERRWDDNTPIGPHERLMRSAAAHRVIEKKGEKIRPRIVYEVSSARYSAKLRKGDDPDVLVLVASPYAVDNIYTLNEREKERATHISPFTLHTILHRLGDEIMPVLGTFTAYKFYPASTLLFQGQPFHVQDPRLVELTAEAVQKLVGGPLRRAGVFHTVWFPAVVNTKACREGWIVDTDQALAELVPMHLLYGGVRFLPTPPALVPDPQVRAECDAAAAGLARLLGAYIDMLLDALRGYRVSI